MTGTIRCDCCGTLIPVTPADLGREVVCPVSRRFVAVPAGGVEFAAPPAAPAESSRRRRLPAGAALAALAVLLFCGFGGVSVRLYYGDKPVAGRDGVNGLTGADGKPAEVVVAARQDGTTTTAVAPAAAKLEDAGTKLTTPKDTYPSKSNPNPTAKSKPTTAVMPAPVPTPTTPNVATPTPATPTPATPTNPDPTPAVVTPPTPTPTTPDLPDATSPTPKGKKPAVARRLVARLDRRTTAELEAELLRMREVSLDTAAAPNTSIELATAAAAMIQGGGAYSGPILLTKKRPDLAELPLRVGPRTVLDVSAAKGMTDLAKKFRSGLVGCMAGGDVRPDPAKVEAMLLGDGDTPTAWTAAGAVPCLRQMLPGEVAAVRGAACEAYRRTPGVAALDALVATAAFDTDFDNRAAAVDALAERDPAEVAAKLAAVLDYPWTPAVEHAAEALVALKLLPATPALVAELKRASAELVSVAVGGATHPVRREMVRVNHARNCVLCHAPSLDRADFVRGALPDPTKPLGGPMAYYETSNVFVRADTTYLRQDFSVVQPVPNPGPWPSHQRFDYLVALRPAKASEPAPDDAGRAAALLFALRGLTGADRGATAASWEEPGEAVAETRGFVAETARLVSLRQTPNPTVLLHFAEFGKPLLSLGDDAITVVLARLRRGYGEAGRYALIAYLDPLLKSGTEAERATASVLMARLLDATAWGRPLTAGERESAAKLANGGNAQLRSAAGLLLLEDPDGPANYPKEFLALLTDADPETRRLTAEALGRQSFLTEIFYVALARAARDTDQAAREAAGVALFTLKKVPTAAGPELAASYLARLTWDTAAARAKWGATLVEGLATLAPADEVWFAELTAAATGVKPTDAPEAQVARLIGLHRKVPAKSLPDLVTLLAHPVYGPPSSDILAGLPRLSHEPLLEGLKARKPADRAAAAKALGQNASLSRPDPVSREQWRAADEALAGVALNDADPEVKTAANFARKALVKGKP